MEGWLVLAIYCELFGLATTLFIFATAIASAGCAPLGLTKRCL